MKKVTILSLLLLSLVCFTAFIEQFNEDNPVPIPASKQRTGNAKKGFDYLITGDYVKSGVPYSIFLFGAPKATNYLKRTGVNEKIAHEYTAVQASNGELVVTPNCLQCHAQVFEDQLVIGLGNSAIDFTKGQKVNAENIALLENMLQARAPKQYEAAQSFLTVTKTIAPYLHTQVQGVNAADRLAATLVAYRDPVTLQWNNKPQLSIPLEVIPSDTPPWWLLKKKNAMFYNGFGRGDFGRFLMSSNLLTVGDTAESRKVDDHMPDVLAYIYSLEAPKYPGAINHQLAKQGRIVFEKSCSKCHGTYGAAESYPNLLIPESNIQTDSFLYKSNYSNPQFVQWFNKSWFTQGDHPALLQPFEGYIAPPLDGIWITAPYLHNGSVPTLNTLLNSKARPEYWSRDFTKPEYDYQNIGWKFTTVAVPTEKTVYNTSLPGYGNYGHYYGDKLTDQQRKSVIEYLKTL